MDFLFSAHIGQIESGINLGLFSKLHVDIFKARIHGASSASIREIYKLCNDEAIAHCLIRSILGFHWNRICHGRRLPYLSGLDQMEFKAIVSVQSHQRNSITKSTAITILLDLCLQRLQSSLQLLCILKI
jgi:hypothetical protein